MHTRRRVAAFLGPAPADFAFLADPAFILHPDFDLRRLGMLALDLGQNLRERLLERRLSDRVCLMGLGRQTRGTRFIAWSRVRAVSGLMRIPHVSFTKSTM